MDKTLKPNTAREVEEAVRWAAAGDRSLEVIGQGSKRALGRPVQAAHVLDLSDLAGVEVYRREEHVLTARAGTPVAQIEELLDNNGQRLAFEPMDCGPLFGGRTGSGTIGGVLAANLGGPRWIKTGAARDHVLGMDAVWGRGETFRSGGKPGEDVTGYDLPRTLCGSYGTLAVATSVTLNVGPKPEISLSLLLSGLDDLDGVKALCEAMAASVDVSGAAHLPAWTDRQTSRTIFRLEGGRLSVADSMKTLKDLSGPYGPLLQLDEEGSSRLWKNIRDLEPLAARSTPVWRLSVAPTAGPQLVARLKASFELDPFYDRSGGLVWLTCRDGDIHQAKIRLAVEAVGGGKATLVRADASTRAEADVFQPQPAPQAALSRRLKEQFDPKGVLNSGRMAAGM